MKLKKLSIAVPALALLAASACDRGLTDVNANPNAPEAVPPANLLANAIMDGVGAPNYGLYGEWFGLYMTNLWPQHLAQTIYNSEDLYQPRTTQVQNLWNGIYTGPLADLAAVKDIAEEQELPNLFGVAEILTQWEFHLLADTYGDIPYSQAVQGNTGVQSPAYDTQAAVYTGMLTELANAAQMITPGGLQLWAAGDLIYRGDLSKWEKFANSLRMRLAMRLVAVDPAKARQEFLAAWQAGPFTSSADNATVRWSLAPPSQNPIFDAMINGNRYENWAVSETMIDMLEMLNDPRLSVYAEPAKSGGYRGLPNGNTPGEIGLTNSDISFLGEGFVQPDAPSVLMSYAEVLFLGAEAAERGWIAADPATLYQAAITEAMEMYDVPRAAITSYLAQPEVAYQGLPSIWTQQWLALFMNGPETWALVRRTGVPNLDPVVGTAIPTRLSYPDEEQLLNRENWEEAVGRAGGKTIYDPLWWMKR